MDQRVLALQSLGRRKAGDRKEGAQMLLGSIASWTKKEGLKRLPNRALLALVVATASALIGWTTAASAKAPTITTQVDKFSKVIHFDAAPECGLPYGSTEYQTGTEHLQIVEQGDNIHLSFGDTFQITQVSDNPAIPTRVRRGADAGTFQLVNNGAVVLSHESFHDFNTDFGDIFLTASFVAVNGKVLVDHLISRNLPPDGC
jgi:hypothetical protein